jgi:hypothetical protein
VSSSIDLFYIHFCVDGQINQEFPQFIKITYCKKGKESFKSLIMPGAKPIIAKLQMNWKDETRNCSTEVSQRGLHDVPPYLHPRHAEENGSFLAGFKLDEPVSKHIVT